MSAPCLTPDQLDDLLHGKQGGDTARDEGHIEECPECRRRLESLVGDTATWEARARQHESSHQPVSEHLRRAVETLKSARPSATAFAPRLDFLEQIDRPGTLGLFDGYEVSEHVASGGMGIVLRARDPRLGRIVALKILSPILAANELARSRFLREARAAAAIEHEHVVPIYAVDEWHGLPYLVMPFIPGRTLAERIRPLPTAVNPDGSRPASPSTGPLAFPEIVRLGAEIAQGLAAAHARGLIHRDIKPGNILLEGEFERAKLADFGLARAADEAHLTSPGDQAGTPEYMSPEQAGATEVDARSDLFSLGTVLYAMSTGASPFRAPTSLATMRRVCEFEPPTLHQLHLGLPTAFSDFVQRLMSKDPAARIPSADDVVRQLSHWREHPPVDPPVWLTRFHRHSVVLVLAVVLASLLGLGWWRAGPGKNEAARFQVVGSDGTQRAEADSLAAAVAASQSGDTVEIRGRGRIPTAPIHITGKALRLRAAPGTSPVLSATNLSTALITSDAPLFLEGLSLEFIHAPDQPPRIRSGQTPPSLAHHLAVIEPNPDDPPFEGSLPPALIHLQSAPLHLSHCRLFYQGHHDLLPTAAVAGIEVSGNASCVITSSELITLNATGIRWTPEDPSDSAPPRPLIVSNSIFVGRLFLNCAAPGPPVSVHLIRSTISAGTVAAINGGMSLFLVSADRCLFDTRFLLHEFRQGRGNPLAGRMNWKETNCLFSVTAAYVGRQRIGAVTHQAEWNELWSMTNTGSRSGALRFPRMVGPVADLRALAAKHLAAVTDEGPLGNLGASVEEVGPNQANTGGPPIKREGFPSY